MDQDVGAPSVLDGGTDVPLAFRRVTDVAEQDAVVGTRAFVQQPGAQMRTVGHLDGEAQLVVPTASLVYRLRFGVIQVEVRRKLFGRGRSEVMAVGSRLGRSLGAEHG